MRIGLRAVEIVDKGGVRIAGREESGRTARELEAEERASHIQQLPLQSSTHSIPPLDDVESDSEDEDDVKPTTGSTAARTIAPPGSDDVNQFHHTLLRPPDALYDAGII